MEEQDWNSVLGNPLVLPSLSFCHPIYTAHSIQVPFRVNGRQNCHFPTGWWLFFSYFCSHPTLWERVSVIHYNHSIFQMDNTSNIPLPLFPILLLPFPLFLKKVTFSFHYNSYYFSLCYVYLSLKLSQRFFGHVFILAVLGVPCCVDFSVVVTSGATLQLWCVGFVCGGFLVKHGL